MMTIDATACSFYSLAKRFCDVVNRETISRGNVEAWIALLMELYSGAMKLPEVEPDDGSSSKEKGDTVQPVLECPSTYWEMYDPFRLEEPVCGDLRDDLGDIYGDLHFGVREYDAGRLNNAIWEWKFSFDNHWGYHAVDAIRALHSIRKMTDDEKIDVVAARVLEKHKSAFEELAQ